MLRHLKISRQQIATHCNKFCCQSVKPSRPQLEMLTKAIMNTLKYHEDHWTCLLPSASRGWWRRPTPATWGCWRRWTRTRRGCATSASWRRSGRGGMDLHGPSVVGVEHTTGIGHHCPFSFKDCGHITAILVKAQWQKWQLTGPHLFLWTTHFPDTQLFHQFSWRIKYLVFKFDWPFNLTDLFSCSESYFIYTTNFYDYCFKWADWNAALNWGTGAFLTNCSISKK